MVKRRVEIAGNPKKKLSFTMAHKRFSRFRRRTNTADPKQKIFQAIKSGDAVLLDEVLQKLDFTEIIFVLDKQYVLDCCSLPGK